MQFNVKSLQGAEVPLKAGFSAEAAYAPSVTVGAPGCQCHLTALRQVAHYLNRTGCPWRGFREAPSTTAGVHEGQLIA